MLKDYFQSRINQSRHLPAFLKILTDISRLRDSEDMENLLARRAGGRLKNVNLMEKLWGNLSHGSSKNILLAAFFETGLHSIFKIVDYSVLLHMIEPDSLIAINAKIAIDKAVVGDLYAIADETSIDDLAAMARTLPGGEQGNWAREDSVISAALEKTGGNFGQAFNFAQNFSGGAVRNRFLICFIAKYGLKDRDEAEALASNIKPGELADNLMGSILDAAKQAGFEFDPVLEAARLQIMKQLDDSLSMLPFILAGKRQHISSSLFQRSQMPPDYLLFGELCADCRWRGTSACPLHYGSDIEDPADFGGFAREMGIHLMFPNRGPIDFLQDLMHNQMRRELPFPGGSGLAALLERGFRFSPDRVPSLSDLFDFLNPKTSTVYFPGFMEHLNLEPGFAPEVGVEISGILPGGMGAIRISKEEEFLPEFPLEVLEKALSEKKAKGVRPETITFSISTNVRMSIMDILASNEVCDLIGPQMVRVLRDYVSLFEPRPEQTH